MLRGCQPRSCRGDTGTGAMGQRLRRDGSERRRPADHLQLVRGEVSIPASHVLSSLIREATVALWRRALADEHTWPIRAGAPPPRSIVAAQPGGSARMSSITSSGALERV